MPCRQREERIIAAPAHVETRVEPRAPLAHDDCPGIHQLATEALKTETLRIGITPVSRTSYAFFVCHSKNLSKPSLRGHDFLDEHLRIGLTVPPKAPIPFPSFLLEHENFRIARMIENFGLHAGTFDHRFAHRNLFAIRKKENLSQGGYGADFSGNSREENPVPRRHSGLHSSDSHYCLHDFCLVSVWYEMLRKKNTLKQTF